MDIRIPFFPKKSFRHGESTVILYIFCAFKRLFLRQSIVYFSRIRQGRQKLVRKCIHFPILFFLICHAFRLRECHWPATSQFSSPKFLSLPFPKCLPPPVSSSFERATHPPYAERGGGEGTSERTRGGGGPHLYSALLKNVCVSKPKTYIIVGTSVKTSIVSVWVKAFRCLFSYYYT